MEELSGEIEVHKREKRSNERENKKKKEKKKTLRSESLTTDNKFLNC
jgi:hypothetical protein